MSDSDNLNSTGEHFETNKMIYENMHKDTEDEDDLPLSSIIKKMEEKKQQATDTVNSDLDNALFKRQNQEQLAENRNLKISPTEDDNSEHSGFPVNDSDADPSYDPDSIVKICEVSDSQVEVFSSCHVCH